MPKGDLFTRHYSAGVLPKSAVVLKAISQGREQLGAAPSERWALGGCVVTPESRIDPGWVVIDGNQIDAVTQNEPEGIFSLDTGGVIMPGLIDLHGHPEW